MSENYSSAARKKTLIFIAYFKIRIKIALKTQGLIFVNRLSQKETSSFNDLQSSNKVQMVLENDFTHAMFGHQQIKIGLPCPTIFIARHIMRMNPDRSRHMI